MELQRVFTQSYVEELQKNINVADYRNQEFQYNHDRIKPLANVYHPEGLLDKMDIANDYSSAIALYEAYQNVTPLVASLLNLWAYLSHVDLFPYMQKRWPRVLSEDVEISYVENHWFKNNVSLMRTTLPSFWWSVYLTKDEARKNPYELTEILFKNSELRTSSFGPLPLIRHKEAMKGILEFLNEHQDLLDEGMNMRSRYIQKLFNYISGYTQLVYMDKDFFKHELEKRIDVISRKLTEDDIKNDKSLFNDTLR